MNSDSLSTHVRGILAEIGEDATREGLAKTPERVARALRFLTKGYEEDPQAVPVDKVPGGGGLSGCAARLL